ncbi:hypothetical protein [Chitinophaga sancti]|uniref:Uncharacterized protein n=1 Tax=Chitinophaga sancti TaxID=1004 RepID=A0A1K1SZV5_9BACT|nr:hypothetical protein [Chitinophaga sancti]WQD65387.1 hypothetical protein U0033_13380 [Chitinophaga sancti]WQG88989.1 hypothetical protein SR876_29090 [Chitinophaga sancti]SFW89788.1 hypothetical protein SAMN05661012_06489 [Chitinophaga sancti]
MFKESTTKGLTSHPNQPLPSAESFAERFDDIIRLKGTPNGDVKKMNFLGALLNEDELLQLIKKFRLGCPDTPVLDQLTDWCNDVDRSNVSRKEILELVLMKIYQALNELTAAYPHLMADSQQMDFVCQFHWRPKSGIRLQFIDYPYDDIELFDKGFETMLTIAFELHLITKYKVSTETFGFEKPSYTLLNYSLKKSIEIYMNDCLLQSGTHYPRKGRSEKVATFYSVADVSESILKIIIKLMGMEKSDLLAMNIHELSLLFPQYSTDLNELDLSTGFKTEWRTAFTGFLEMIRTLIEFDLLAKEPEFC